MRSGINWVGCMSKNGAAWGALRRPVTMREAAKLLGVSFSALERLADGYRLLTIRVGRRRLVPVSELLKHRD